MDLRTFILLVAVTGVAHAINRFHETTQALKSIQREVIKLEMGQYAMNSELERNLRMLETILTDVIVKEVSFLGCSPDSTTMAPASVLIQRPQDCRDMYEAGYTDDGVYKLDVDGTPVRVFCEDDGWTVIQRRYGTVRYDAPNSLDFNRAHIEYAMGFGDIRDEHWLGLDTVHHLTANGDWTLHIELESFDHETSWVEYTGLSVGPGPDFVLDYDGVHGPAGDSLGGSNNDHASALGMKFTTYDNDQDENVSGNCAEMHRGGWWYHDCGYGATTTTLDRPADDPDDTPMATAHWMTWRGYETLKTVTLKIKRN